MKDLKKAGLFALTLILTIVALSSHHLPVLQLQPARTANQHERCTGYLQPEYGRYAPHADLWATLLTTGNICVSDREFRPLGYVYDMPEAADIQWIGGTTLMIYDEVGNTIAQIDVDINQVNLK